MTDRYTTDISDELKQKLSDASTMVLKTYPWKQFILTGKGAVLVGVDGVSVADLPGDDDGPLPRYGDAIFADLRSHMELLRVIRDRREQAKDTFDNLTFLMADSWLDAFETAKSRGEARRERAAERARIRAAMTPNRRNIKNARKANLRRKK